MPIIKQPNQHFDATLYTGTGSTQSITNAGSFQPDLVWVKNRSGATDHALYDAVRGTTKQLESNTTTAETTEATGLTAFGTNGFTIGALAQMNTSANNYVGWQWKAGGASTVNTSGSISSNVSVNATAGFSVVTYTGSGSGSTTVGHGLGVAPAMIIIKDRVNTFAWNVYHKSLGNTSGINLNSTDASVTNIGWWNNTSPTSSVFTAGTYENEASNYVAYCWAEVEGYSKFGSYTGNGNANGVFVYLGFRPKFVMIKQSSAAGEYWNIIDASRSPYNVSNARLSADQASAESTAASMDLLSNGFKIRESGSGTNTNGATYIYMAFAEAPFKNSNAR
jgi:hypothetical protein